MTAQPCSCRSAPTVLRIALLPGPAPEVATAIVQAAIREYYRQRRSDDFPAPHTPESYRAACREIARPYVAAAMGWHTPTGGR